MPSCASCEDRRIGGVEVCLRSGEHVVMGYCLSHLVTTALFVCRQLVTVVAPEQFHGALVGSGVDSGVIRTPQEVLAGSLNPCAAEV